MPRLRNAVVILLAVALAGCGRRIDPRAQEAYDLVVQGSLDQAVAFVNSILADEPDNAQVRNVLGLALYKAGDAEASIEQYLEALEDDPEYAEAYFNLGNSYEVLGRIPEAEQAFASAVQRNKKFDVARLNLGLIYKQTGRPDEALEQWTAAVEANDQFDLGFLQIGLLEAERGDQEGAIASFSRVLELKPTAKTVRVHLGNAYLRSGRDGAPQLAENEFRAAVGIDPEYVDGLYSLGVALATQERQEEAIREFEKVWNITAETPDDPIHQRIAAYFDQIGYKPPPPAKPAPETEASG